MKTVIAELQKQGLRTKVKGLVRGVPTSQESTDEVGANARGKDALQAISQALKLAGV